MRHRFGESEIGRSPVFHVVEAGVSAAVMSGLRAENLLSSGPQNRNALIASIHGTTELWLDPMHAFMAQLQGRMELAVQTQRGGVLELVNGHIERTRNPSDRRSGRILNPLISLEKLS